MSQTLTMLAPAKLNLYLRVCGLRPDGYHELETIFERIDLCDELSFALIPTPQAIVLTCDDPNLSCGEDNLALKAARLLQEQHPALQQPGISRGVSIHLKKRIPTAAGLGGGSSDAAAVLLALNRLWALALDNHRLTSLAQRLGADVPAFLSQACFVLGQGRGDVCEPLSADLELVHVLVVPDERLSTREVFQGARFDLTAPVPSASLVRQALNNGSLSELAEGTYNQLEPEAIRRCPTIRDVQARLMAEGCLTARVSGSGPSVYGLCRNHAQAEAIACKLQGSGRTVAVVKTMTLLDTIKPSA